MPRCIDCAWFPWKPGADFSMLPVARCHPNLKARRWPGGAATAVHECPYFAAKEGAVVSESPKDEMTVAELRAHVETITDPAELERLLAEELQREEPRKTAVKLLEDRLNELKQNSPGGEGNNPETGKSGGGGHDPNAGTESGTSGTY